MLRRSKDVVDAGLQRAVRLLALLALAGVCAAMTAQPVAAAELVMFEEPGCPWCARWDREVAEAYAKSDEGRIAPLRRIHISAAATSGLRLAAPVTVTPTFVLVDGPGEVGRITGYPGADFFWGMLTELMKRLPAASPPLPPRDARRIEERSRAGQRWVPIAALPAR